MNGSRILIACIGNMFFGDDAFGCEVARLLVQRPLPDTVRVVDFGIRGRDLAYELAAGYDAAILVDAMPRGRAPGTLYVLEPNVELAETPALQGHGMDPVQSLRFASNLCDQLPIVRIVGCEPSHLTEGDELGQLSPEVQAAIPLAVRLIEELVTQVTMGFNAPAET